MDGFPIINGWGRLCGQGQGRRRRRHVVLLVIGMLSITVTPLGQAAAGAAATPPEQPASGPGGRDYRYDAIERRRVGESPAGAFVFAPAGLNEPDASLPLVLFIHGFTAVNPDVYEGWIEHLVRRGAIVVYPEYQPANPLAGPPDAYLGDMMAGIRAALLSLNHQGDGRVIVAGHSLGAILAVNYAALAAEARFPAPDVLMAVEPGGCRTCGVESGFSVPLPASPQFPRDLRTSVVVGNDDTVVGEADARWVWSLLGAIPAEKKAYVRVRTDRHGEPALVADHQIPLTRAPGALNALDWNGVWRLLDL